VVQSIANDSGLQDWAATLFSIPLTKGTNGKNPTGPTPVARLKTVNEELKRELLKILLEVYMGDELVFLLYVLTYRNVEGLMDSHSLRRPDRAAHLLNAQAINLDVLDVRFTPFQDLC